MFPSSLAFRLSILLFNGVLHGGSTCWFIKDLIPSQSFHQDSFLGSSSFLHIVIRSAISFYHIIGGGIMSFLIIWVHVFHDSHVVKNELFLNPSTSLLELSCVIFHLKPSIGNVAICGAYQWSKLSLYHLCGRSVHLFVDLKQAIVSFSGRLSPHNVEMFP